MPTTNTKSDLSPPPPKADPVPPPNRDHQNTGEIHYKSFHQDALRIDHENKTSLTDKLMNLRTYHMEFDPNNVKNKNKAGIKNGDLCFILELLLANLYVFDPN
ncbi:hypothetical protein P8452_53742 [Trifolium repens]|nr:hypothetical protein P8452_53742 [Trifolium repens]